MTFSDVVTYIESLPDYNSPDIFGMTDNAEKACRELQADDLMNTVVSVQPRLSMGFIGYDLMSLLATASNGIKVVSNNVNIRSNTDEHECQCYC